MSDLDIKALKSISKDEYLIKTIEDSRDFTSKDKSILFKACSQADDFFNSRSFIKSFKEYG